MILVDTNLLLRLAQIGHPHRETAWDAINALTTRDDETFAIVPQNLYELYVVCTRPVSANGLGMTAGQGRAEIASARRLFQLLTESGRACTEWELLIGNYEVRGKPAHDARLVAMMIVHSVPRLLTFNDRDFRRYVEITAINPFDVLGIPRNV